MQYDAVTDDASGENSSPDFFWDSAARITERGWIVEMRIPFSSLRYRNLDPQTWGIILFRNYPRQYRYQLMSAKIPRGNNCLICRENLLSGLEGLPKGGHLIAAPYVSATHTARPADDVLGSPLVAEPLEPHAGIDVKYTPNANNAIDLTIKPDFSQVESDTAQISANERFALFFPEKRPFFLEGVDLLQTPIQAVYTRTITAPTWGARITGKEGGIRYTALVTEDAGGGSAVLPGPTGSSSASVDAASRVFVGRAKREFGLSFIGALVTDREAVDGNAHNRVAGPDFQWRPSADDVISGQWLFSATRTPNQPELASEWNGQQLSGSALQTNWSHNTRHLDLSAKYNDVGSGFRADTGFVPQVGYREGYGSAGWTVHPKGFLSSVRSFVTLDYQAEPSGAVITRDVEPGIEMNTRWSGFVQCRFIDNQTRAGDALIGRRQFGYYAQFSPSRLLSAININGTLGQDIDFENARPGRGSTINASATVQPTNHLALDLLENTRWLDVDGPQTGRRATLHPARLADQGHLHVHGTAVRPRHRPVCLDHARSGAVCRERRRPVGRVRRLGALRLQAQLAVGDVRGLRRRSTAAGPAAAGPARPPGLRQALLRLPALVRRHDEEKNRRDRKDRRERNLFWWQPQQLSLITR